MSETGSFETLCSVFLTNLASFHQPRLVPDAVWTTPSVAATVSHLLGLPASSTVIMTIYRPSPLAPDVYVMRLCYDEAEMSYITGSRLLSLPLWLKEKKIPTNNNHMDV